MALQSINTQQGKPSTIEVTIARPFRLAEPEMVDGVQIGNRVTVAQFGEVRRLPLAFAGEVIAAGKAVQGKVSTEDLEQMGYVAPPKAVAKPARSAAA